MTYHGKASAVAAADRSTRAFGTALRDEKELTW